MKLHAIISFLLLFLSKNEPMTMLWAKNANIESLGSKLEIWVLLQNFFLHYDITIVSFLH